MKEPLGQKLMRQLMLLPMAALAGGLPIGFVWAISEMGKYRADLVGPGIAFAVAGAGLVVMLIMGSLGERLYGESWWVSPDRRGRG